ncbi:triose-phosphate isomerase [Actinomadura flavalba]|uniref:triose-phosphate isomerase n=1 Tax=Actinomadura flavalba TaxID=1120938 RepID=UPI00037C8883|nr:triose-phosphate isomerase family protein [Actinomadura flavalba]
MGVAAGPAALPARVTGTNTKGLLGRRGLAAWLAELRADAAPLAAAGFFVAVPGPLTGPAARALEDTGIAVAGQDCWHDGDAGVPTGEVAPALLAEVGCTHVLLGHADRRALGEDDALVARKAAAAARAGLVPVVTVGETGRGPAAEAVTAAQASVVAAALPPGAPLVLMYEPAWTIGAEQAAAPEYAAPVLHALHAIGRGRAGPVRVLYGGAVVPGVFSRLAAVAPLDGVGLGRAAHDAGMRREVLAEVLHGAAGEAG